MAKGKGKGHKRKLEILDRVANLLIAIATLITAIATLLKK